MLRRAMPRQWCAWIGIWVCAVGATVVTIAVGALRSSPASTYWLAPQPGIIVKRSAFSTTVVMNRLMWSSHARLGSSSCVKLDLPQWRDRKLVNMLLEARSEQPATQAISGFGFPFRCASFNIERVQSSEMPAQAFVFDTIRDEFATGNGPYRVDVIVRGGLLLGTSRDRLPRFLPYVVRWPEFVGNTLVWGSGALAVVCIWKMLRGAWRRRQGLCDQCGYPIEVGMKCCPECGSENSRAGGWWTGSHPTGRVSRHT